MYLYIYFYVVLKDCKNILYIICNCFMLFFLLVVYKIYIKVYLIVKGFEVYLKSFYINLRL